MGTSGSFGGPGDTSHLLPTWARPGNDAEESSPEIDAQPDGSTPNIEPPDNGNSDNTNTENQDNQTTPQPNWQAAKGAMSRYASRGSGQGGPAKVGKSYVGAKGGAKRAGQAATSGKATARNLASFFSTTARSGIAEGLYSIGLGNLIGKDIDTVFSGLVDAIADDGEDFIRSA
jgi:hypothetical protein